jgi:hypothetical protein
VEARGRAPMMPLGLFRSRTFGGANGLTLLLYGALGGALYFFPFDLQQVQGYSATAAGAALLPFTVIMFGLSRWASGLVKRYGARLPLTVGPLISAAGFLLFMRPGIGGSYWTTFFPAVVVLALGMAVTVAPLTTTVMGAVATRFAGVASGINNAVARTAGLLAIAVLGIVVASVFDSTLHDHLTALSASPAVRHALEAQRSKLAGTTIPAGVGAATHAALRRAVDASFVAGFRMAMLAGAVLALLSALTAAVTIEGKAKATAGVATIPDVSPDTSSRPQPAR